MAEGILPNKSVPLGGGGGWGRDPTGLSYVEELQLLWSSSDANGL
jgi:hypothetical protein